MKKQWLMFLVWLVCMVAVPMVVKADDTTPLALTGSTPENNAQNVATNAIIVLEFNNNVVAENLRTLNINAITLWQNDAKVDAEVCLGNDASSTESSITVIPKEALREGKTYTLRVDTTISAKDGARMAGPAQITFTTADPNPPINVVGIVRNVLMCAVGVGLVAYVARRIYLARVGR